MRGKLVVSFLVSSALGAAACSDEGVYSPSDPAKFDRTMFDDSAIASMTPDERAYVMGHAIGTYLMGKTVPAHVADRGYYYRPGKAAPHAGTPYDWEDVLVARSGGSDGNGGAIYDDVSIGDDPPNNGTGDSDPGEPGTPSDDVEPGEGGESGDGDGDGGGGGNGDGGGGGDGPPPDEPGCECDDNGVCIQIDPDCSVVLNPPAREARALAGKVDPQRFAWELSGAELVHFTEVFEEGMTQALNVADFDEWDGESEVLYLEDHIKLSGLCEE